MLHPVRIQASIGEWTPGKDVERTGPNPEQHEVPAWCRALCTPQRPLYYRSQFQEVLNRFAKREGIEGATPHTVSTLVRESGHTLKATQELLDHSSSTTTPRVYTHTSSDTMDRIADALQSIFGDANLDIPDPDDVIFDERSP
jgi:integrase